MATTHTLTKAARITFTPRIMNEYGRLLDVIVSPGSTVIDGAEEKAHRARFVNGGAHPRPRTRPEGGWQASRVREQHEGFLRTLEEQGVHLHHPHEIGGALYSLFTRDIGFVVHDRFVHARMADPLRAWERYALSPLIAHLPGALDPDEGVVEGGDVIVHGSTVYLGVDADATNDPGLAALRTLVAPRGIRVIPIRRRAGVPHLDQRFAVIGPQTALVHRPGLDPLDVLYLEAEFNLIDVPADEVDSLAAGVLAIAPDTVFIEASHAALRRRLRSERIEPIPVPYDEVTRMGGSFHQTTLPVTRDTM